jgi:hypothetical protein
MAEATIHQATAATIPVVSDLRIGAARIAVLMADMAGTDRDAPAGKVFEENWAGVAIKWDTSRALNGDAMLLRAATCQSRIIGLKLIDQLKWAAG